MGHGTSALDYHQRTKHSPQSVREGGRRLDFDNKPRPYKIYPSAPSRALSDSIRPSPIPALAAIAGSDPSPESADSLDLDSVTQLCYYSVGITRRIRRRNRELLFRAAACTGALYHIDFYLVTGPIGGLEAGVYHVDPMTLSLDVLREGDYRGRLAESTGDRPAVESSDLSIVATSTWWRNAWKYGPRTYRHAFWDTGTVAANTVAVARSLDLPVTVETGFVDSMVADLIGVNPDHEAPIAIIPIGKDGRPPSSGPVPPIDPATEPLSDREIDYPLITEAYSASTLDDPAAVERWYSDWPDTAGTRAAGDGERIELAPVGSGRASKVPLYRTIARRGSCRGYSREPLNFRKVSTLIDRAINGVALGDGADRALRFNDAYCLANGIDSVPNGTYHLHPDDATLERLDTGDFRQEAGHLALDQRLGADAALSIYFMTDLDTITAAFGDRGYRLAQLEAAITAGRLYLGAYAHRDLGATGLTFYDDTVTEFFSPRAAGQTPTFLWTLGRPA